MPLRSVDDLRLLAGQLGAYFAQQELPPPACRGLHASIPSKAPELCLFISEAHGIWNKAFDLPVSQRRQTSQQIAQVGERFHAASATAFDDGVEYGATVSGFSITEKQPVLALMQSFP
jgi:hypothetical protein